MTLSVSELTDRHIGVPFVLNGRDPELGIDCLGWMLLVYKEAFGIDIPDPIDQPDSSGPWSRKIDFLRENFRRISMEDLEPGGIAYFGKDRPECAQFNHVAVYDQHPGWWSHTTEVGLVRSQIRDWGKAGEPKFYALHHQIREYI